ncbi:peroxiredoxin [Oceanicaulis alexandrii]|jgi:alkyl hydroperoxide reductase subunit AhpC|uniref:peroxiredoxin n=1 Tax=Oceanicaulis alexandrii TaxID=153233 RepID=UPI0003B3F156|nr:peroxiredoxin [Oceanicaulis alexandrii]MBL4538816.1 peroxiredoxin [Oceanicaulis sp.]VXC78583.1 Peroxiredoxin [Oceanicaulis sp. 350]
MGLLLGDIAPNFEAETTEGKIKFHDWIGDDWVVFFSHPADYTPVCTTELGYTAKLKDEFAKRGAKAIALSVDPIADHHGWVKDIEETQGVKMNFPIIADTDRSVSELYTMIHPNADPKVTVRAVYIIDPNKKIRATFTYPPSAGRNFNEVLRLIDSLQLTDGYKVATPVNWEDGQDVIVVPSISDEEADKLFPKGYTKIKPYLRTTPQPDK